MPELNGYYDKRFSENNDNPIGRVFRRVEHKKILKLLKPEKGDRILEVGCNSGGFVKKLKKYCDDVTGIDINRDAVKASCVGNIFCMSAEKLDFSEDSFNKIVSMHTIEHVPDIERALDEMGRVVEKNGKVILSYPFEPIRGLQALPTACFIYRNPAVCRQLHLHKLIFTPLPTYFTILKKAGVSLH